jgi:hypothetical protein
MVDPAASQNNQPRQGIRQPPPAPSCPPNMRVGPPDFVGVGAQRCGTTRWFDLLAAHPNVSVPPGLRKELHFFDRFHAGGFADADADVYHEHFPRPEGSLTGEWTPLYMAAVWVPAMLAAAAPTARLLVLLRDPVERYISAMRHHARMAELGGVALSALAPFDAYARGLYGAQLIRLLAHFDRAQVLVQQYERCVLDTLGELRRTYHFLGLPDPGEPPAGLDAHPNRQPGEPELRLDARAALIDAYAEDVTALARNFPEIDLALWPNFAGLAC